ncbi:MAG: acid phosphatase type 7, partial [Gaiellales bacterium]|nr:acid phosphatase type 7 [Gaiellales bacterium]
GPGTYCYRVQLGSTDLLGTDPSPQVKTAAASGTPFSFAVFGDWGAGTSNQANVMSRIGASPASFVVTTGDNVYNSGNETEYGDLTQGNVFQQQYLPAVGSRPFFAAEGNHGFSTNLPYLQNFPAPTAAQTSGGRYRQESYCCISTLSGAHTYASSWYAFNWGSARFYVLEAAWADSQGAYQGDFLAHWNGPVAGCGPCGAELQWLKADLAAHPGTLKFAFFHYPLHADSSSQGSDTYLTGANGLEGLLANNGVGIVFNGHAHHYERNYPQITGKPMVSYVTGGGGAALGSVSSCSAFDAYAIGSNSSCRAPKPTSAANVYHFLLVTVNGNQVTVTPTDSTGRTFDVQTYTFPGGSGDTSPPTAPSLTAVAASPTQVNLSWTASSDNVGVTGYTIVRNGATLTTTNGSTTSFADMTAAPASTYTYTVRATDAAGNLSPLSNSATAMTPPAGDTSPPTAPSGLTAAAPSPTRVDLSWTGSADNVGVTGYKITRNGATLTTVGNVTSFADTTAAPNTAYTYSVQATDAAGNLSPASNSATATTPPAPTTFTFTPTDDAYVEQVSPSTNFGAAARIVTDNSPVDNALMKFTVATGGCTITSATLSLTVGTTSTDASPNGGDLHTTAGTAWSEGTVTWANAPAANTATIASLGAITTGTTYTLGVTSAVTGDGVVSFRLTSTSSDGARYFSKEGSSTQQPKLTVNCA